jgi:spore coat polysaccharide biosynthesis predicted glycosyltransferase SpsG
MKINDPIDVILMSEESNSLELLDSRFTQVKVGPGLESELAKADLIFTLSGTSSWDFLSCGYPLGIALGFENQRDNYNFQISNGIAVDIGYRKVDGEFKFQTENIKGLISNSQLRKGLSKKAVKIVDKYGVSRIKDEIVKIST